MPILFFANPINVPPPIKVPPTRSYLSGEITFKKLTPLPIFAVI